MPKFNRRVRYGLGTMALVLGLSLTAGAGNVVEATWYADRLVQLGIVDAAPDQPAPPPARRSQPMESPPPAVEPGAEGTTTGLMVTYLRWRLEYFERLQQHEQQTPQPPGDPTPSPPPAPPAVQDPPPSTPGTGQLAGTWNAQERELLALVNARRRTPFQTDARLQAAAEARADALLGYYLRHRNIPMNHFIPGDGPGHGYPPDVVRAFQVEYRRGVGENIGAHRDIHRSNAALWASPGHRRNLEDAGPWTHIGIGVRDIPGVPGVVVVQLFVQR